MTQEIAKAKAYALKILNIRPHSEQEFREKLARKKYSPETVTEITGYCRKCGYLDDALFARAWIQSRLNNRPKSRRFIEIELLKKGLDRDLINRALDENGLGRDTDFNLARRLAKERYEKLQNADLETVRRRLSGYLARRGFGTECIYKIIKEITQE